MSKTKNIDLLREDVLAALKTVTPVNAPNIHERIQTKEGYVRMESEILSMVLSTGQAPIMCIPQLESEL